MNIVAFELPKHTHLHGPECEQMAKYLKEQDYFGELVMDPMNDYAGFVPELPDPTEEECSHWSCLAMIYEDCIACEIEAQAAEFGHVIS